MLSDSQIERYSRQIILPQIGGKGQEVLLRSKVLVNGDGALRDAALLYLAAAGVGTIGLSGDPSSPLFTALCPTHADPISATLTDLNPDCRVIWHRAREASPQEDIVQSYDLVLSVPHEALHARCYALQRPFLCAALTSTGGWLFVSLGYRADFPCLRCVAHREAGEERAWDEHAQLSLLPPSWLPLVMYLGTLQVTEAIKCLLGIELSSARKVWHCSFSPLHFSERVVEKDPQCSLCGPPRE